MIASAPSESPTLHELTDSELFCRYRDLDCQDSFSVLYTRYAGLRAFLQRKFSFDESTSEDVTQQAWLDVTKSKHAYSKDRPFKSWLIRIAQNAAKRANKQPKHVSLDSLNSLDGETNVDAWEPIDHRGQPVETRTIIAEVFLAIDELIASIDDSQMAGAISLVFKSGFSLRSASKTTGVHLTQLCRVLSSARTSKNTFPLSVNC